MWVQWPITNSYPTNKHALLPSHPLLPILGSTKVRGLASSKSQGGPKAQFCPTFQKIQVLLHFYVTIFLDSQSQGGPRPRPPGPRGYEAPVSATYIFRQISAVLVLLKWESWFHGILRQLNFGISTLCHYLPFYNYCKDSTKDKEKE